MHMPISVITSILPFFLPGTSALKPAGDRSGHQTHEICIDQLWLPGECVIQVEWYRIKTDERDERWGQSTKITEKIRTAVYDSSKTRLTPEADEFTICTGQQGEECIVNANLGPVIKLSPQIQRDYLQFYFGDQAWNTSPRQLDKSRPFVGKEYEDLRPYCEDGGWKEYPKNETDPEYYNAPYGRKAVKYLDVKTKEITCWFDCKDITGRWGDPKVRLVEPKSSKPISAITKTKTLERVKTLTKTITGHRTRAIEASSSRTAPQPTTATIISQNATDKLDTQTDPMVVIETVTESLTSTLTETETTTSTLILLTTVTDIPAGYTLIPIGDSVVQLNMTEIYDGNATRLDNGDQLNSVQDGEGGRHISYCISFPAFLSRYAVGRRIQQ
ncbi:hypothetical protein TWF481_003699 [Arthrobotrys musiformis]|uniref:Uncharacterized protein n=1 Tax=Arthrobotrys musiformis TaxID=47236 RepID=A0AAV9WHC8_9PEZI